jgi:glutaconate CoA-transferase subunit A
MPEFLSLAEAVKRYVRPGACIAPEGFAQLIPFAAVHEIIRQRVQGLTVVRLTPDVICDQLVGMGCVEKLVFSWLGNPGVGSLYRVREAIEQGWPQPVDLDERSIGAMTAAYEAGASGLPIGLIRSSVGELVAEQNPNVKLIDCPFTGQRLAAVAAINPDVAVLHAQQADSAGNVHLWGITGVQKQIALAAKQVLVTVEEVVPGLQAAMNACVLPKWTITAISEVPGGAYPSYAHDYYGRDNAFYSQWDTISRSRDLFLAWMKRFVLETKDCAETLELLANERSLQNA